MSNVAHTESSPAVTAAPATSERHAREVGHPVNTDSAVITGSPLSRGRQSVVSLYNSRWLGVGFIIVLLVLWEIAAVMAIFPPMSFPRISSIIAAWWQLVISGQLVSEVLSSLWRMFAGYFIGVVLGIGIGLLMGYVRFFYNLLEPITEVLRPIPSPAYLPIMKIFISSSMPRNKITIGR